MRSRKFISCYKKIVPFLVVFLFTLLSRNVYSQFGGCNCSDALNEDLKTKYSQEELTEMQSFLYDYLSSSVRERKKLKRNNKSKFGGAYAGIELSFSSSGSKKSSTLYSAEQEVLRIDRLSTGNFQRIISEFLPNRAFDSYDRCVVECGNYHEMIDQNGLKISITEETEEIVLLQVSWDSNPAGRNIEIESADYTNGVNLHERKLYNGRKILDGQTIVETIQRSESEDLVVVINFKDPIDGRDKLTKSLRAPVRKQNETTPIGSIIASVLDYDSFLAVNGIVDNNFNIETSTWAPCDGRAVGGSEYGTKIMNVPDLRGLFIRGVNDMKVAGQSNEPSADQRNVEDKEAGSFQKDALKKHKHHITYQKPRNNNSDGGSSNHEVTDGSRATRANTESCEPCSSETRPKNMSVFYYIRIN